MLTLCIQSLYTPGVTHTGCIYLLVTFGWQIDQTAIVTLEGINQAGSVPLEGTPLTIYEMGFSTYKSGASV